MATLHRYIVGIAHLSICMSMIFITPDAYPAEKLSETNQTARLGSIVVLHCKPRDGQPVRWFYQQSPGAAGSEIYFNGLLVNGYSTTCDMDVGDGEWNLIIKTVAARDAGIYSCIEENGQGDYRSIHLSVIQSESASGSIGEKNQTAAVGSTAVLHCKPSNGLPVRWFYKQSLDMSGSEMYFNGALVNGYRDFCEMDTSADGEWNLIIKGVTADNSGLYLCIEDNGQGDYHMINLSVIHSDPISNNSRLTTTTTTTTTTTKSTQDAALTTKTNYIPVIIATVVTALIVVASMLVLVLCYRHSNKSHGTAAADHEAGMQLLSNMESGSTETSIWLRVEKMKDDLLPPTVPESNLHRWTSDEFVHEVIQFPDCFAACVDKLEKQARQLNVDVIFGVNVNDSRGEIFARPLAKRLGIRYQPIWPAVLMDEEGVRTSSYFETRFGHETKIGIRADACKPGDRVLIVDSYVITARIKETASELIERELHAKVVGFIVFAAATNEHLPRWPLYSVFPPYFKQDRFRVTDEGLHVYVPPNTSVDRQA